jgi:hypothetical protein
LLPLAQLALNGRDATSIGVSSFFLGQGYNLEPLDIERFINAVHPEGTVRKPKERWERITIKLRDVLEMAQSEFATAQQRREDYANRHQNSAPRYRVG